jgi:hypothetical protein
MKLGAKAPQLGKENGPWKNKEIRKLMSKEGLVYNVSCDIVTLLLALQRSPKQTFEGSNTMYFAITVTRG